MFASGHTVCVPESILISKTQNKNTITVKLGYNYHYKFFHITIQ